MKINWGKVQFDLEYMILNRCVNRIPSWTVRKKIYQAYGMRIGDGARICVGTVVISPQKIKIGNRTVVNEDCLLDGRGGLDIGHDTSISMYSKILTASHRADSDSFRFYTKRTVIGNYVWLGTGAVVLDGSRVHDYVILGANAVLKGDVEEKMILAGNPAKVIKKRGFDKGYCLNYKAYFR